MRYNMKLEDFFTVEELEYGLANPARVEELVNAMLEEVDCTVENASEASRPWSGVANVISATNNKSCLDIFINLGEYSFGVGTSKTGGSWGFGFAAAPYSYPYYDMNGVTPSGAFPYMVDSRGVPVVPQIMPFHKSHPYFPNAVTTLGIGPSHFHTVDLNSSFEDGVREPPFLRQLLMNGDARMVDEHLVLNAQPGLGSGIREKRNEPAGGWDPYPFPTKRQLPPWR